MSIWNWIRGLLGSKPEPGPIAEPLTGAVQSVADTVVVLLDSGRIVHCPAPDGTSFHPAQRVTIDRIEVRELRSIGVGICESDRGLQQRHLPELDEKRPKPEPKPKPLSAQALAEQDRRMQQAQLEARARALKTRRAWLEERPKDRSAALRQAGGDIPADFLERVAALRRPCLRLIALPADDEGAESRVGGRPFLPADTPWPEHNGRPLSFLAQLQLSTLPNLPTVLPECPPRGRLLFFYDAVSQEAWGFDPADAGSARVVLVRDEDDGILRDFPADLPAEARFPPCALNAVCEPSLPASFSVEVEGLFAGEEDENRDLWDAYWDLYDEVEETPCGHQLGGHPHIIQNPMAEQCELVSRGAYLGGTSVVPALRDGLEEAAADLDHAAAARQR